MDYTKALFIVSLMLPPAPTSYARQAEMKSFAAGASEFRLLEPGFSREKLETSQSKIPVALDSKFALLGSPLEPMPDDSSKLADLKVPSWMRGKPSPTDHIRFAALSLPPGCGPVRYAPHPMLKAAQEMRRQRHYAQMAAAACGAGVPVELFDALIIQESRYNSQAVSSRGATGLAQLMPGTARTLGVFDRWSIAQNLDGGARYLRQQLDTFGNWALALGAYNAGPGSVTKYGGLPPFRETRGYVRSILAGITSYQRSRGEIARSDFQSRREVRLVSFTD